jgi:hypothetical protein
MPENLSDALLALAIGAGFCVVWGVSTGAAYWDLRRTRASQVELVAWIALVALLPVVGLLAYLTWRLLGKFLTHRPHALQPHALPRKRVTAVQRPDDLQPRKMTIPAADLLRETLPEPDRLPGSEPEPDGFTLHVETGPHVPRTFSLDRLPATIGRGDRADVRLDDDQGVSRSHAEVYLQAGALRIRDLDSTHGTLVNGFSIRDIGLEPGDRIRVGMTEMVLERKDRAGERDD